MKILFLACLLFSAGVSAADWKYVATNGTERVGNEISYDKASVVNNGNIRKVWLKFHAVGTSNPQRPDSKQLWSLRCRDRQYTILVLFDDRGNDLAPNLNHSYTDIQPDSWMEDLLTNVCAPSWTTK